MISSGDWSWVNMLLGCRRYNCRQRGHRLEPLGVECRLTPRFTYCHGSSTVLSQGSSTTAHHDAVCYSFSTTNNFLLRAISHFRHRVVYRIGMLAVLILCHVVVYRALNFMQSKSRVRSDEKLKVLLHATYLQQCYLYIQFTNSPANKN